MAQEDLGERRNPTAPMISAALPHNRRYIVLSVGEPVKIREKPEAMESEELTP